MPAACNYSWPDDLDLIIRAEAAAAGVPLDLAYTFIAVESGFNPRARNLNPPVEDSVGLLQLNRIGGQGTGFTVEQLEDPTFNLRVGLPPIAAARAQVWTPTVDPFEYIFQVAISSGHPGLIPRTDPRIRRIATAWACFVSGTGGFGPGLAPGPVFVPAPGDALAEFAAATFGPGLPTPVGAILGAHAGSLPHVVLLLLGRRIVQQLVWRMGPRTIVRRQLRALSPAGMKRRFITAIDPRAQLARAFRLPYGLASIRLPRRHRFPRW